MRQLDYGAKIEENIDIFRHRLRSFLEGVKQIFRKFINTKLNLGQQQRWAFLEMRWLDSSMSSKHSHSETPLEELSKYTDKLTK